MLIEAVHLYYQNIKMMHPLFRLCLLILFCATSASKNAVAQIWPGDINDNGEVNSVDLLYWALSKGTNGVPRTTGTLYWEEQPITTLWTEEFEDGQNFAYADCNGDGQIDLVDQIIIQLNQDSTHNPYLGEDFSDGIRGIDPLLWLGEVENENIATSLGSSFSIPIHLGSEAYPLEGFFGVAFRIMIDTGFIEMVEPIIEKTENDWLFEEASMSILNLSSSFQEAGKEGFEVAFYLNEPTATVGGFGKIGALNVIIVDDLTLLEVDTTIEITIEPIRMVDAQLTTLNIVNDTLDITIYQDSTIMLSTGEQYKDKIENQVQLYPNPVNQLLEIALEDEQLKSIEIFNSLSQLNQSWTFASGKTKTIVDVASFPPGLYWLRVTTVSGAIIQSNFIKIDSD